MTDSDDDMGDEHQQNERAINLPFIIIVTIMAMIIVRLLFEFVLNESQSSEMFIRMVYLPQREQLPNEISGGIFGNWLSLFTYPFVSTSWTTLILEAAFVAIFGSVIVERYGNIGFILVFGFSSAIGAFAFEYLGDEATPFLIGANAAMAGLIGGSLRFAFQPTIVVVDEKTDEWLLVGTILAGVRELMRNQTAIVFGVFYLGINVFSGMVANILSGQSVTFWQAHLGGFIAGFFMVAWLERRWF